MILTVGTDQLTLQTINETLPRLRYCHGRRLDDDGRTSVADLHWWSAAPARSTDAGDTVSVSAASVLLAMSCIAHLSHCRAKTIKDDWNKKQNTSFTHRKSEGDLETNAATFCQKRKGWQTFLTVHSSFIGCVARRWKTGIYTNIHSRWSH